MELKDRLKHLRAEKNTTATQLAFQIGKGEGAVRMWEIGRSKPDAETIIKLATYFDCTTDYLLGVAEYKSNAEYESKITTLRELDSVFKSFDALSQESFTRLFGELHNLPKDEQLEIIEFINDYVSFGLDPNDRRNLRSIFKGIMAFSSTPRNSQNN